MRRSKNHARAVQIHAVTGYSVRQAGVKAAPSHLAGSRAHRSSDSDEGDACKLCAPIPSLQGPPPSRTHALLPHEHERRPAPRATDSNQPLATIDFGALKSTRFLLERPGRRPALAYRDAEGCVNVHLCMASEKELARLLLQKEDVPQVHPRHHHRTPPPPPHPAPPSTAPLPRHPPVPPSLTSTPSSLTSTCLRPCKTS